MAFTATPLDGSTTPIPMPTVVPDATNTPLVTEGGPSKVTGGNTLAPVAVYQYDGYNVTQGVTTDTAVTGDTSGTISAKLRGLSKIFFDVWDSINHRLHVNIDNANANGQTTMSASAPVVVASDQAPVAIKSNAAEGTAVPANPVYIGFKRFGGVLSPFLTGDFFGLGVSVADADQYPGFELLGITSNNAATLLRTPDTFKTAAATAVGNTAVWTPATGKKFHLLAYRIEVTANAAQSAAGVITLQFQDATTALNLAHPVFVPAAAGTTFGSGYTTGWVELGGWGILSAAANNALNINLSTALTAGTVRVVVSGTEE